MFQNSDYIQITFNLTHYKQNLIAIQEYTQTELSCLVLKADAYGLGLKELSKVALESGIDYIGICNNHEAETVRDINKSVPILRLRTATPQEIQQSVSLDMQETITTLEFAKLLDAEAKRQGKIAKVHIAVDTGMGREGFLFDQIEKINAVFSLSNLKVAGIMSHYANAISDPEFTQTQTDRLAEVVQNLSKLQNLDDVIIHYYNSPAIINQPKNQLLEKYKRMTRIGELQYYSGECLEIPNELNKKMKNVIQIKTFVGAVKELPVGWSVGYDMTFSCKRKTKTALLPVGWSDGISLYLSNAGKVLINGQHCPIIGRISMNITSVDITDLKGEVKAGDEVIFIGDQGDNKICPADQTKWGQIPFSKIAVLIKLGGKINYVK